MSLIPESWFTRVQKKKVFGRSDNNNDNNNIWNQRSLLLYNYISCGVGENLGYWLLGIQLAVTGQI